MLSAQAMETLSQFQESYEEMIMQKMHTKSSAFASLNYEKNRYYLEILMQHFSEDEIKHNYPMDIVRDLTNKKLIRTDAIEFGRAVDAVKLMQHYLLTRSDV